MVSLASLIGGKCSPMEIFCGVRLSISSKGVSCGGVRLIIVYIAQNIGVKVPRFRVIHNEAESCERIVVSNPQSVYSLLGGTWWLA